VLAAAWAVRRQRPAGPRAIGVLGLKALEFEGGTSDGDAGGLSRHRISVLWRCRPGQVVEGDELVTMAHPFTAAPLGFSVMGRDSLWWGGCAWDSFALPHLPDQGPMLVATTCPACDRAHAWRVDDREPPAGDQVAHFLVPAARMWDDVVYTCGNQRIFCSEDCLAIWLNESGHQRGSVLDLRRCGGSRPVGTRAVSSVDMSAASRAPPPTTCAVSGSPARSGASPRGDRRRAPVGVPVIRPG
jgi:hypothetical protein